MIFNSVVQREGDQSIQWTDLPLGDGTVTYYGHSGGAIIFIEDVDASESACVYVNFEQNIITNPGGSNISISEVNFETMKILFEFSPGSVVSALALEGVGLSI